MKLISKLAIAACVLFGGQTAIAQEPTHPTIYFGAGAQNDSGSITADDTPFSLGIYARPAGKSVIFGFDYGREGSMLDSTGGGNDIRTANSYNLLVGGTIFQGSTITIEGMGLLGMRESFADCPDSYLGFRCYADQDPATEFEVNYGALLVTKFEDFAVGVRATGESTQLTVGLSF